jgi:hypothetical protein
MPTVSLSGNDTVLLGNRVFTDVADGDYFTFTFPNELASVKTGKNGNSIFALNATGKQAEATLRLIRGSNDDKFLDALLQQQLNDFAGFALLIGVFVKRAGDGQGNVTNDTYRMAGGMFSHQVDAKSNAEGDTDQSVSVYRFRFTNAERAIL